MSMSDRDGKIWMNGRSIGWRDANSCWLSHTVPQRGIGAFEGIRACKALQDAAIIQLRERIRRLFGPVRIFQLAIPFHVAVIETAQTDLSRANGLEACSVLSCGRAPRHLASGP